MITLNYMKGGKKLGFVKNTRKVKCKRCGEQKECLKDTLKGVNICLDCLDNYNKAKINCSSCKKSFAREAAFEFEETSLRSKNFCSEKCYRNFIEELEQKDKMVNWLKEYYKTETLPTRIYTQIEDFKSKKKISYKTIFGTLRFITQIKKETLQEGTIGIVPYKVDECKDYIKKMNKRKEQVDKNKTCRASFVDNVIVVKNIDVNKEREKLIRSRIIQEEDLGEVMR